MAWFRSRLVVEVESEASGGYRLKYPDGQEEVLTAEELHRQYVPEGSVMDWRGGGDPGFGDLIDADGNHLPDTTCYADLDTGIYLYYSWPPASGSILRGQARPPLVWVPR